MRTLIILLLSAVVCFGQSTFQVAVQPIITTSNGNNQSGTTSTTGVMAGLAKTITPLSTGRLLIMIDGQATNSTGDSGFKFDLRYGTGNPPANGTALTGTQVGGTVTGSSVASGTTTAVMISNFSRSGVVTGLTKGTTYWIDIGQYAVTSGTATFSNINVTIIEL